MLNKSAEKYVEKINSDDNKLKLKLEDIIND